MNDIKTVVIVESCYLLQSGLEKMLMELPRLMLAKTFSGDEPNLVGHILKQEADILIINPLALKTDLHQAMNTLKKNRDLVIFGLFQTHTPLAIQSLFSHYLEVNDTKFDLQSKIRSVMNFAEKSDQQRLLSQREITVLKQVVLGFTNQEIADKLFLSIHTVTTHRKNINRKLGIKTVSGLTVYAMMNHMVSMDEIGQTLK
jgi:DNA-binding NarL/FixJ family response regulator